MGGPGGMGDRHGEDPFQADNISVVAGGYRSQQNYQQQNLQRSQSLQGNVPQ